MQNSSKSYVLYSLVSRKCLHWEMPREWAAQLKFSLHLASLLESTGNITAFYRLLTSDGQMLYSKNYKRVKTRNSYTVGFVTDSETKKFGEIIYFIETREKHSAVVNVLDTPSSAQEHFQLNHSSINSHLFAVVQTDHHLLVPVNEKCISINVGQEMYLGRFISPIVLD